MEEHIQNIIHPKPVTAVNRYGVHEMMNDRKRFQPELDRLCQIRDFFVDDLFNTNRKYVDLYSMYLVSYQEVCNYINRVKKPKYWIINSEFFAEAFKPIERPYGEC